MVINNFVLKTKQIAAQPKYPKHSPNPACFDLASDNNAGMPRPRTNRAKLQITLDEVLSPHIVKTMKEFAFKDETEYVAHIVRAWLSVHGYIPDIAFPATTREQAGEQT